jgi:secreted Zn-dependent insulinase-like peptidase
LHVLVDAIAARFAALPLRAERLAPFKERLARSYRNWATQQAHEHVAFHRQWVLGAEASHYDEQAAVLASVTVADLGARSDG